MEIDQVCNHLIRVDHYCEQLDLQVRPRFQDKYEQCLAIMAAGYEADEEELNAMVNPLNFFFMNLAYLDKIAACLLALNQLPTWAPILKSMSDSFSIIYQQLSPDLFIVDLKKPDNYLVYIQHLHALLYPPAQLRSLPFWNKHVQPRLDLMSTQAPAGWFDELLPLRADANFYLQCHRQADVLIKLGYHPWIIEGVMALIDRMPARQGLQFSACLKDGIKNNLLATLNDNVGRLSAKTERSNSRQAKTIKNRTLDCLTNCFSGALSMEKAIIMTGSLSDSLAALQLDAGAFVSDKGDGFFAKRRRFTLSASVDRIADDRGFMP